ncbi:MAG: pilus assembly protein [Chloroflexi bacterium]|nr:pilus assembly protein [Chloroflexota bacterium]
MAKMVGDERPGRRALRGQSIVELALLLPVLLMLVLGALDLGRAFYYAAAVANATRVGAQYAIDPAIPQADIKQAIVNEASPYLTLDPSRITFTTAGWADGNDLTVNVSYDFRFLIPLAGRFWSNPLTMHYTSIVRFD